MTLVGVWCVSYTLRDVVRRRRRRETNGRVLWDGGFGGAGRGVVVMGERAEKEEEEDPEVVG
jgi:hypothetical protein